MPGAAAASDNDEGSFSPAIWSDSPSLFNLNRLVTAARICAVLRIFNTIFGIYNMFVEIADKRCYKAYESHTSSCSTCETLIDMLAERRP
jgi:hypothetical protein